MVCRGRGEWWKGNPFHHSPRPLPTTSPAHHPLRYEDGFASEDEAAIAFSMRSLANGLRKEMEERLLSLGSLYANGWTWMYCGVSLPL